MLPLPRQRAQLQWQNRVLSDEQLAWLAALPAHARQHDVELWHGSAQDPLTGWISSPQDATEHLARQQTAIGLVGHTHRPLSRRPTARTSSTTSTRAQTTSPSIAKPCSIRCRNPHTKVARTRSHRTTRRLAHRMTRGDPCGCSDLNDHIRHQSRAINPLLGITREFRQHDQSGHPD